MCQERITTAAIQIEGVTMSLPRPARHAQVMYSCWWIPDHYVQTCCQGFMTSEGRFVNRVMAKQIAWCAGQKSIRDDPHDRDLFSEDLW